MGLGLKLGFWPHKKKVLMRIFQSKTAEVTGLRTELRNKELQNLYSSPNILLLSGIYNPYEFEPPHSGRSEITHKDVPQSV